MAAAVTSMVALAFLVPLSILVRDLARDRAINRAERDAEAVARVMAVLVPTVGAEEGAALVAADPFSGFDVSIVQGDRTLTGPAPESGEDLGPARAGTSFRASVGDGVVVYVPVPQTEGPAVVVRVAVPAAELERGVAGSWITLGGLGVVLVLFAILVADRLGLSVVRPVRRLSDSAQRLGQGDLGVRVEPEGPDEVQEVGRQFNRMAGRIASLLQHERETAADLSHRLRTPLTAARLDAEALPAGGHKERLLDDLAELERTVSHVIAEARRPIGDAQARSDMTDVVDDRVRFWEALAEEQDRRIEAAIAGMPLWVQVSADGAGAVVDALLGNVFAHTEVGVGVLVTLAVEGGQAVLTVEDDGPGFADALVAERGRSGTASTGLGLDIVRRTAESVGGSAGFGAGRRLRGARIVVRFPLVGQV